MQQRHLPLGDVRDWSSALHSTAFPCRRESSSRYGDGTGYSGTYFVKGYESSNDAETTFIITAEDNTFYSVRLRYAAGPN